MALIDRDIIITPNRGAASEPNILFRGADAASSATINLRVYNSGTIGTVSFEGNSGQLLSITDAMSGSIFSVNDVTGIPSIEVFDTGEVRLAEFNGFVSVLNSLQSTSTNNGALRVTGGVGIGGNLHVGGTIFGNVSVTGVITTATNIAGGTAGQVPYQTAAGVTSFYGPGTTGNVLVSNGTSAPTYNNTLALAGTTAATNATSGALTVAGGVGINNNLFVTNNINAVSGQFVSTRANNAADASGQIYLNGATGNRIDFNSNGVAAPTFTTRSAGTKLVLYPNIGASTVDFALGIEGNTLWFSTVNNSAGQFKWYGGTTQAMLLSGAGNLTVTGDVAVNGGDITSSVTTFNLLNATVTTANVLGAGTNITIGATTGATTIRNATTITAITAATSTATGALQVRGGAGIGGNLYVGGTLHGTVNSATNIAGGAAMSLPYQSAASTTAFLAAGTAGQILQTNGTGSAPTWINASGVSAGSATNADNIRTIERTTNATHFLTFVDSNNASNAYEALYTTSSVVVNPQSRNVGIGVTSPSTRLDIADAARSGSTNISGTVLYATSNVTDTQFIAQFRHQNQSQGIGFSYNNIRQTGSNTNENISLSSRGTGNVFLRYNSTDSDVGTVGLTLLGTNGNVGISTSTPQYRLDVNNSNASIFQASFGSTLSTGGVTGIHFGYSEAANQLYRKSAIVFERSDGGFGDARGKVHILNGPQVGSGSATLADARLSIATDGNIGLNTQNPVNRLHVVGVFGAPATSGSAQNGIARFAQATGVGSLDVGFGDPYSWIQSRSSADYATNFTLSLNPNGGNVAVGTTSTLNRFEVAGTAGQLFSVSDSFTGTIFSVNDVSGIPSIEVIDTGLVKIAQYNGQVAISTSTALSSMGLTVNTATYITSLGIGTAASGVLGEIRATNEITAYFSSDARLKENVTVISNPIEMIKQIRGVYFDWTDEHMAHRGGEDGYFVRKHDVGVIAQEVEAVLPELVGTREDGYLAVKYEKMVPLLIEAIKEQQKSIDMLKFELEKLKNNKTV
jgi:cytoskeletal protein CcmA (bactofilin family)